MNRNAHTSGQADSPSPAPHRFVLCGGTIHDPLHGRDGIVDDIWVEDGRIVAKPADPQGLHADRCQRSGRDARRR
jgi:hypothetical protein